MPQRANFYRKLVSVLFGAALVFGISQMARSRAELLPHHEPGLLWMLSDLVVYGEQTGPNTVKVDKVLKGTWPEGRELRVENLHAFTKVPYYEMLKKKDPPSWMTNRVCLFLSLRQSQPRIVDNGIFRLGNPEKKEIWLGYFQYSNPGFYYLVPYTEKSKTTEQLEEEIKAGPKLLEAQRATKLTLLKETEDISRWTSTLNDLEVITRWGDVEFSKSLLALPLSKKKHEWLAGYLERVRDPNSWPLAKQQYEETNELSFLRALGTLGNPDAAPFLEKTARTSENKDHKYASIYTLHILIKRLNETGDRDALQKVSDLFIKLFQDDIVPGILSYKSGLLADIPDPRALELLKNAAEKSKDSRHVMDREIEENLKKCEECLRKAKAAEEIPKNPQKAQENTGSSDTTPTK